MRKKTLVCYAIILLIGSLLAWADSFNCSGSGPCTDCEDTHFVFCSLQGTAEGATSCQVYADGASIRCVVKQGTVIVAETTRQCSCDGSGGHGTYGEYCDPFGAWWVSCDPFPAL